MSCERIRRELAAYCEGLLEPAEAAEVAGHLSACEACRAEADRLEAAWALLAEDESLEAPAELARRVLERIRDEDLGEPAKVVPFPAWRRWVGPALASAAAVLIIVGALLLQRVSKEAPPLAGLSEEERQIVANLDLLEDYDLLENIELLENMELLERQEVVQKL